MTQKLRTIRKMVVWSLVNPGSTDHLTQDENKLDSLESFSIAIIGKSVLDDGWLGANALVQQLRDACRERWPELIDVPADSVDSTELVEY